MPRHQQPVARADLRLPRRNVVDASVGAGVLDPIGGGRHYQAHVPPGVLGRPQQLPVESGHAPAAGVPGIGDVQGLHRHERPLRSRAPTHRGPAHSRPPTIAGIRPRSTASEGAPHPVRNTPCRMACQLKSNETALKPIEAASPARTGAPGTRENAAYSSTWTAPGTTTPQPQPGQPHRPRGPQGLGQGPAEAPDRDSQDHLDARQRQPGAPLSQHYRRQHPRPHQAAEQPRLPVPARYQARPRITPQEPQHGDHRRAFRAS